MRKTKIVTLNLGNIMVCEQDGFITDISVVDNLKASSIEQVDSDLLTMAEQQIKEYFKGNRKAFSLPLKCEGTDFQKQVWQEILKVPYGQTTTYKQIAIALKKPKAYRAVGLACGKNPILIVNPCHRVLASNGSISGFAAGIDVKRRLLQLENIII